MQGGKNLPDVIRPHIGPEIARPVLLHFSHDLDARVFRPGVDAQIGVMLVVFQEDVVLGAVLFDQIAFQDERFQIGGTEQDVKIRDVRDHRAHLDRVPPGFLKILAYAVFQVDRLADIDHRPGRVLHKIAAGTERQVFQFDRNRFVHGIPRYAFQRLSAGNHSPSWEKRSSAIFTSDSASSSSGGWNSSSSSPSSPVTGTTFMT